MLPKDATSHLNLTLTFNIEGFNYVIFVTSETMKCFGCGAEGHLVRACPEARQEAGGSGSDRPAAEAGGSGPSLPATGAAVSVSDRPVAGVVAERDEEEHPGETCSPVALQDAKKTGQDGLNMQEKTKEGQTVKGTSDNSVRKKQMEEKEGQKVCSNGDSALYNVVMEDICDDTGLTVKTNKRKKRAGRNTQNEAKTRRVLQAASEEEEEEELTASQTVQTASYSVEAIKQFLAQTKGQRHIQLQHFFPSLTGFIESVAQFSSVCD